MFIRITWCECEWANQKDKESEEDSLKNGWIIPSAVSKDCLKWVYLNNFHSWKNIVTFLYPGWSLFLNPLYISIYNNKKYVCIVRSMTRFLFSLYYNFISKIRTSSLFVSGFRTLWLSFFFLFMGVPYNRSGMQGWWSLNII